MNDDTLHKLFHDAVADVHPHGTADDVLARTNRPPRQGARHRAGTMLAVAAATAAVIGAVTWLHHDPGTTTAADQTGKPVDVQVFYLGGTAQPKLFRETHTVTNDLPAPVAAVVESAGRPEDNDYRIGLPAGTEVSAVLDGDRLHVDLRGAQIENDPAADPTGDGVLALQALVKTANANSTTPLAVDFTVDGAQPRSLLGVVLDGPLAPASDDSVLSPVQLDLPTHALLANRSTVTGQLMAFEATATWRITDSTGATVADGFVTASECCTLSPFSFALPDLPAGDYALTMTESDPSDGEGAPAAEDSKSFTIG